MRKLILLLVLTLCSSLTVAPTDLNLSDEDKARKVYNFNEYQRYDATYELFINQLGLDESGNNWLAVNSIGAFSEFQFMDATLRKLGYPDITSQRFQKNPQIFPKSLQRKVVKELIELNTIVMRKYITQFENKIIYGVKITKAGILAACHLAGPKSVQDFLLGKSDHVPVDLYGTTVLTYLKKYQIYDLNLKLI